LESRFVDYKPVDEGSFGAMIAHNPAVLTVFVIDKDSNCPVAIVEGCHPVRIAG
jgi:hypothetical protein